MSDKIKLNESIECEKNSLLKIISDDSHHLIFGRNGIGKTTIANSIAETFTINQDKIKIFRYEDFTNEQNKIFTKENQLKINYNFDKLELNNKELQKIEDAIKINAKSREKIVLNYLGTKLKRDIGSEIHDLLKEGYLIPSATPEIEGAEEDGDEATFQKLIELINKCNIPNKLEIDRFSKMEITEVVDENYIRLLESDLVEYLEAINEKITGELNVCPICETQIPNLKQVIETRIKTINDFLSSNNDIVELFHGMSDEEDKKESMNEFIRLIKEIKPKDDPEVSVTDKTKDDLFKEMILSDDQFEILLKEADDLNRQAKVLRDNKIKLQKEKDDMFAATNDSLAYVNKTISTIDLELIPDESEKTFSIKLNDRSELKQLSEGEKHTITFIITLIEMLSNEVIDYVVMDDPLTSYDLLNQHNIIFNILKASDFFEANGRKTKLIILSHNLNIFDLYENQYGDNNFTYWYIEKNSNKNLEFLPYYKKIEDDGSPKIFRKIIEKNIDLVETKINNSEIHELLNYLIVKRELISVDPTMKQMYNDISKLLHFDPDPLVKIASPSNKLDEIFNKYIDLRNSEKLEEEIDTIVNDECIKNKKYFDMFESLVIKNYYISVLRQYIEKKLYSIIPDNTTKEKFLKEFKLSNKIFIVWKAGYITEENKTSLMLIKTIVNASSHLATASVQHMLVSNLTFDILVKKISMVKTVLDSL